MLSVSLRLKIIVLLLVFGGCSDPQTPPEASEAAVEQSLEQALAGQLVQVIATRNPTSVLSQYPDMEREMAYKIQMAALDEEMEGGNYLVGWKLGGTRVVDPAVPPDPSFAYVLRADSMPDGVTLRGADYVDGDLLVEAEIAFIMGKDLQGEVHSMEEVADAVAEVAGAIELIDIRIVAGADGVTPPINHMIAAKLSHAGVLLTDQRHPLEGFDLVSETATAYVNGEAAATGNGGQIMGTTPLDALYWLANALPKQGHYLRAGDVVITGSLYDNPTLVAGKAATVEFTSFGSISVSMEE